MPVGHRPAHTHRYGAGGRTRGGGRGLPPGDPRTPAGRNRAARCVGSQRCGMVRRVAHMQVHTCKAAVQTQTNKQNGITIRFRCRDRNIFVSCGARTRNFQMSSAVSKPFDLLDDNLIPSGPNLVQYSGVCPCICFCLSYRYMVGLLRRHWRRQGLLRTPCRRVHRRALVAEAAAGAHAPVRLTPPARHNSYSQRPCPPLSTWLLTSASMHHALRSQI